MSARLRPLLLLAAALLAGCERSAPPAPASPPVDRPPPDDPTINALQRAWQKTRTERTAVEALIAAAGADDEAQERLNRRWAEAGLATRLPASLDETALAAGVLPLARAAGLTLTAARLGPTPEEAIALPATVPLDAPYPVTPALALLGARCELELSLPGAPEDGAQLQRFFEALRDDGPLLHLRELKTTKTHATFVADCFALRALDPPPVYALVRLDLATRVKAEGLAELPPLEPPSAANRALSLVASEMLRLDAVRAMAEQRLAVRSLLALREARLKGFEERRDAAAAVTFAQLQK